MPHQVPHSQPPPPNIGHGQSNLFGGIISGGPGGPGLIAPPQMGDPSQPPPPQGQQPPPQGQPQGQPQPPHPPHHPQHMHPQQQQHYGGPMGPNGPQGGPPHSPYMGGNGPQQGQPQPKRFKTENDGPRFKTESDVPPPAPGSMYGNMSPNSHGPNGQGMGSQGMGPNYNAAPPSKQPVKPGKVTQANLQRLYLSMLFA